MVALKVLLPHQHGPHAAMRSCGLYIHGPHPSVATMVTRSADHRHIMHLFFSRCFSQHVAAYENFACYVPADYVLWPRALGFLYHEIGFLQGPIWVKSCRSNLASADVLTVVVYKRRSLLDIHSNCNRASALLGYHVS